MRIPAYLAPAPLSWSAFRTIYSRVCFLPFNSVLLARQGQIGPHTTWTSLRGPDTASDPNLCLAKLLNC